MDQPNRPPSADLTIPGEAPRRPLYSPKQVAAAAFLGSPIAGCWLLASNFDALDQPATRRRSLLWGLLSTLVLFVLSLFLPKSFPNSVLPIAYTVAIYHLATQYQGAAFAAHRAAGGSRYSSWRVAGIGLAFLAAVAIVFIGIALLLPESLLPD